MHKTWPASEINRNRLNYLLNNIFIVSTGISHDRKERSWIVKTNCSGKDFWTRSTQTGRSNLASMLNRLFDSFYTMCGRFGLMVQNNLFLSTVSQLLEQEILNNRKKLQMEALAAKQVRILIKIKSWLSGLKRTKLSTWVKRVQELVSRIWT